MPSLAGETLKKPLINIADTNFQIHSIKGLVCALYCDAATLWLEESKH